MSVIRHNTDTGNMGLYADKAAAGSDYPVYASEADILKSKATLAELARFYNKIAEKPVNKFSDKTSAARRVWAMVQGTPISPEEEKAPAAAPSVPVATPAAEKGKRGRKRGTGKFAGKTIYPKCSKNPRRNGVKGWHSYEIILGKSEGVPYEDYVANGGRPQDLQWDIDRKWAEVR